MQNIDSITKDSISFIKEIYGNEFIPLHRPIFIGNEKEYLSECIESNFVSSVGKKVDEFEQSIAKFTNSKFAIATASGTAALHVALKLNDVNRGDEVITQSLTFIATCNAISYQAATPIFIDVDKDTMSMSPTALRKFLEENTEIQNNILKNKITGKHIKACLPMHTFGMTSRINEIKDICDEWKLKLIEDSAESLGSYFDDRHTGTYGNMGIFSFNGNKIITTGGGGMIITDDEELAIKAKHISTTSKRPHPYKFIHDEVGFNYRLPNLNAALGCAQIEKIDFFLDQKKKIHERYKDFFDCLNININQPIKNTSSNYWLNSIILSDIKARDKFITTTNNEGVMTRPFWTMMSKLSMFRDCISDDLINSNWLEDRVVCIPSSVPNMENL